MPRISAYSATFASRVFALLLIALVSAPGEGVRCFAEDEQESGATAAAAGDELSMDPGEIGGLLAAIKSAIDGGSRWLSQHQNPDGGYGPYGKEFRIENASDVGLTAYVLYAYSRNVRGYSEVDGPFISKAIDFLLARQQANGAFYDLRDPTLLNYKTSVVLMGLTRLGRTKYAEAISRGREFIKGQQFAEDQGYDKVRHLSFGGIGYGGGLRPDVSNTQFGVEALSDAGLSASDELWVRARTYLRRTLNSKEVDPLVASAGIGTTGDGGARYAPNDTRGPVETLDDGTRVFSSYGSMSYAALKSFLHARVDRRDPAVAGLFRLGVAKFQRPREPRHGAAGQPGCGAKRSLLLLPNDVESASPLRRTDSHGRKRQEAPVGVGACESASIHTEERRSLAERERSLVGEHRRARHVVRNRHARGLRGSAQG